MGLRLVIEQDQDTQNPRGEFDHVGKTAFFHSRYAFGDKKQEFSSPEEFVEWANTKEGKAACILPVYMYDHSGVTIRTGSFQDPWDSGQLGWIYVKVEDRKKEKLSRKQAYKILEGEVKELDSYLTGDVWGFMVKNEEDEVLESCCGFYGHDYCEEEGKSMLKYCEEHAKMETRTSKVTVLAK